MSKDPKLTFGQHAFKTEKEKIKHLKKVSTHGLFHILWSKTGKSNNYDKEEWIELEKRLAANGLMKP